MSRKKKNLEPGSWVEIYTNLRDKQVLKIVGYRGEMMHCVDDDGKLTMVKPNSPKVSKIILESSSADLYDNCVICFPYF